MIKGKKGDITDGIFIIVMLFFLAVSFIVVAFVNDKFKDIVTDTALNESNAAADIADALDTITTKSIQRGFVLIFAFLCLGTLISSFLVRVHHVWIFIYIIFAGLTVFLTVPLANAYNTLISADALAEIAGQQTMITWVWLNSVKIMIGVLGLSMIVLFAKPPTMGERI